MQPEAGLKVPLSLPVIFKEASHACVGYLPLLNTVFPDLLDGWFSHCWAGAYADPLGRRTGGSDSLLPRLSEVEVGFALTFAKSIGLGRQREVRHAQLQ